MRLQRFKEFVFRQSHVSRSFAYEGMILLFLAGTLVGWMNGELRTREYRAKVDYVGANVIRLVDDGFDRGVYMSCRTFLEYFFAVSYDQSIVYCQDIVRDSREYHLSRELYWLAGYEPAE